MILIRFPLSLRNAEDLLAECGIDLTHETARCCVDKFGLAIAANIRKRHERADCVWNLDEMVVRSNGKSTRILRVSIVVAFSTTGSLYEHNVSLQPIELCLLYTSDAADE